VTKLKPQVMRRLILLGSGVTLSIFPSFEAVNLSNVLANFLASILSILVRILLGDDLTTLDIV
jgi:hypothetical protein